LFGRRRNHQLEAFCLASVSNLTAMPPDVRGLSVVLHGMEVVTQLGQTLAQILTTDSVGHLLSNRNSRPISVPRRNT
jgi:hypothetical protein